MELAKRIFEVLEKQQEPVQIGNWCYIYSKGIRAERDYRNNYRVSDMSKRSCCSECYNQRCREYYGVIENENILQLLLTDLKKKK